ncbi:MAG: FGGY family carbohydrate kinase [Marmoricola sp.]
MTGPAVAYLGLDLGTSGLKLSVVGENGSIVSESEAAYDVRAPRPGHAETDPADWAAALESAAMRLSSSLTAADTAVDLRGIGVTGQMHGVVLTDDAGTPVRPAILWPDQRAAECLGLWSRLDADARGRLSNPIVAGMPGPALSWLREFEPKSRQAAAQVTFPKDWLRGLLTGDRVTERTDASASLLWDVVADGWSSEAMQLAGISGDQLPALVACDALTGSVQESASAHSFGRFGWGGVPVAAGGSDVACVLAALQTTQRTQGWQDTVVINLGTGIQIVRPEVASLPRLDAQTHLYADSDGGWYEMVAIQNGGLALGWAQHVLGFGWDEFVAAARSAPAGAAGASFSPFLTGERGVVAAPAATAAWSGLTPSVGRAELARSAFEALAFTIRRGLEALNLAAQTIVLTGGGAREPWVRQLIGDVLGQPLRYVPVRSASAIGAAALAARGVGESLTVATDVLDVLPAAEPRMEAAYASWLAAGPTPVR